MRTQWPYRVSVWSIALALFAFTWLLRFNDPGGSFAGLTDDHFFYLARGWQILFGDLPVRDFVDHGAPLYYYVGAAVQVLFGRGTVSELAFSVSVLSFCAVLTFWLCTRASGSVLAGLLGAAFHVLLDPRFYNYPKILVYAVAIPLLWRFTDRPTPWMRFWIALVTAVGFLFRHDHGVFVGAAMAVTILLLEGTSWAQRARHALVYGAIVCALLLPYFTFVEMNGGVTSYFRQASAWAEKDRNRAPVVFPGPFDNPDGVSDEARAGGPVTRAVATVRDNMVAWMFYVEIALPLFALALIAASRNACRPAWPQARAKLAMVAVLALVLDAFFLRSPLAARLADPSVPLAILVSWLAVALPQVVRPSEWRWRAGALAWACGGAALVAAAPIAFTLAASMSHDVYRRLDRAGLTERMGKSFERASGVARQLRADWQLETWAAREDRPELVGLSLYVNACTKPTDRVLVQAYMPQVLAMARRAFAGGHADLRPGFFGTEEAQRLTVARLERQSVPIILFEADREFENFRKSFPLVMAYVDAHYHAAGAHVFDGRFGTTLYVRNGVTPTGTWAPLGWPCYGSGLVHS
ncbi:MAG TPA: hypothetical protein VFO31_24385 [Vicinamibacterales bacterium]|nr:hypothetical protein [Vicinamibacterales bacterium]